MPRMERILFPTKFDELSFVVVQQLLPLRQAGLEEIVFLFVIERDEVSFDRYRGFDEEYAEKLRGEAETRFEDWEKMLRAKGLRARHRIEVGDPAAEILQVAREEKVDLIVAGRQRETPLEKVYLGGTSMSLVRNSEIPVLVTKPVDDERGSDERVRNPFARVLFATDFSDASRRAQSVLESIGAAVAEIDVVTVLGDRDLVGRDEAEVGSRKAEAQAALDAVERDLSSAGKVRTHLLRGGVTEEILRLQVDQDSTLILMGTTGKHGLKELWMGSSSHRCVEHSDVPVLLVPRSR